jgi:hypothetical protein
MSPKFNVSITALIVLGILNIGLVLRTSELADAPCPSYINFAARLQKHPLDTDRVTVSKQSGVSEENT